MRSFDSWRDLFAEATEPISLGAQQRGQGRFPLRVVYQSGFSPEPIRSALRRRSNLSRSKVDGGVSPFRLSQLLDSYGGRSRPLSR